MKAKDLQPGDVLVDRRFNAQPTRIAEVDHSPTGQVAPHSTMVRFSCQDEWFCLNGDEAVIVQ